MDIQKEQEQRKKGEEQDEVNDSMAEEEHILLVQATKPERTAKHAYKAWAYVGLQMRSGRSRPRLQ